MSDPPRIDTYFVQVAPADGSGGSWYILTCAESPDEAEANAVACEVRHKRAVTVLVVYDSATWRKLQQRWKRGRRRS
jgi:hypothetical protein